MCKILNSCLVQKMVTSECVLPMRRFRASLAPYLRYHSCINAYHLKCILTYFHIDVELCWTVASNKQSFQSKQRSSGIFRKILKLKTISHGEQTLTHVRYVICSDRNQSNDKPEIDYFSQTKSTPQTLTHTTLIFTER